MPPQLAQLARALSDLTAAHRDLAAALDAQHDAMRRLDTEAMNGLARRQESIHRRILRLEQERRKLVAALARAARLPPDASLAQIAAAHPEHADALMALRAELRARTTDAAAKTRTCARVAGSVLAHLNSSLRLLTGATVYRPGGDFAAPPARTRVEAFA